MGANGDCKECRAMIQGMIRRLRGEAQKPLGTPREISPFRAALLLTRELHNRGCSLENCQLQETKMQLLRGGWAGLQSQETLSAL